MIPWRNARRFLRKAAEQPLYAARVGWKRAQAYTAYRVFDGRAPLPESVTFFLTHRCNLRCRMCGQWGEKGATLTGAAHEDIRQELSLEELRRCVDEISSFRPAVTLFGGEPFLHPHAMELIRAVKSRGMHCLAITNGSLLKDRAQELVELGLDELNISLDGDAPVHDAIRGMSGLFSRIVENIDAVNACKRKSGSAKPLINLQCTINRDNYTGLETLLDVAERVQANSLTFHNLIFLSESSYEEHERLLQKLFPGTSSANWKGFVFESGIDPAVLQSKLDAVRSRKAGSFVNVYPNFGRVELQRYYQDAHYLPHSYPARCVSPWIAGYIFPDGEVRPCLNIRYSYGNIRQKGFAQIWNSPEAVRYRTGLKRHRLFPACRRCTELFRY
jgi:radical SAM protein with 4Fe4S-binding SPASM domain